MAFRKVPPGRGSVVSLKGQGREVKVDAQISSLAAGRLGGRQVSGVWEVQVETSGGRVEVCEADARNHNRCEMPSQPWGGPPLPVPWLVASAWVVLPRNASQTLHSIPG